MCPQYAQRPQLWAAALHVALTRIGPIAALKVAKKKRMEFLKQQRDRLMAKKKEEREAVSTVTLPAVTNR